VGFVLDQHAELDFYRACSLKERSADIHVAPLGTWTHYSDSALINALLKCQMFMTYLQYLHIYANIEKKTSMV
jgi:hypothetical protein